MLLIPAIDLKDGHCVRLEKGDMNASTTFGEDPAAMAQRWLDAGARRLHLVDLNGAFAGKPVNEPAIKAILRVVGDQIPVEEDLCTHFALSRTTVRKALDALVTLGLLRREQGRGTFVAEIGRAHV